MRQVLIIIILVISVFKANCQSWGDSSIKREKVFYSVEKAPKFPGGIEGFYKFLADNLKKPANPFATFSNKIVYARIYFDKTGKIVFAEIEKGVNKNYDDVVLELLKKMPDWSPALQNG